MEADARTVLNVHFCPVCGVDTMPDDRTGQCFWCTTTLCEPADPSAPTLTKVRPAPKTTPGRCVQCDGALTGWQTRYCSASCKQRYWLNHTDRGAQWLQRHPWHGKKAAA